MNIIKLQDKIHPTDEYFNTHLKGKYAWWPRLQWVVPFDIMTDEQYAEAEQIADAAFQELTKQEGWYSIFDLIDYVDTNKTNCFNSINALKAYNTFTPDADITVDELKKFRTWLATSLYNLGDNDPDTLYMLNYYKNGMWDDALDGLNSMLKYNESDDLFRSFDSKCSCCGSTSTLAALYSQKNTTGTCDPIQLYRTSVYNKMVSVFSDINYWISKPAEFLQTFKSYIDNMLKINLIPSINVDNLNNAFVECTCNYTDSDALAKSIMERLSTSLEYIINCQITGHKNYISDAFIDWSTKLYEHMEWNN